MRAKIGLFWALVLLISILTGLRIHASLRPHFAPGWEEYSFYDFRIFRSNIDRFVETGRLYATDEPGYFLPGSRTYKYPPLTAALLRPLVGVSASTVGRSFLLGYLAILVLFPVCLLRAFRVPFHKAILAFLVYLNWQPLWETLGDLQIETLTLLLLGLALVADRRGKPGLSGFHLGIAGAFKVYPWILLAFPLVRRRWRTIAGAAVGVLVSLVVASAILPPRLNFEYFTSVFPRLGGTSLSYENLSVAATLGRLGLESGGNEVAPAAMDELVLEELGSPSPRRLAAGGSVVVAGLLLFFTWRRLRQAGFGISSVPEPTALALALCFLLLFMPTSWLSYQTLLALPFVVALLLLPAPSISSAAWWWWGGAAAVGCTINAYSTFYAAYPAMSSLLRSLVPVALGMALLLCLKSARGEDVPRERSDLSREGT